MSFRADNEAYEQWLRGQCAMVEPDLLVKHEKMRASAFGFLRATYFRWAGRIEHICPELKNAPSVLSVADVHLENFGTWRDAESRLVWGINDFDEVAVTPYPFDLVRLATSVRLAPSLDLGKREAADAILRGYCKGLEKPRPALLDERETWMRPLVACTDKDRRDFWRVIDALHEAVPPEAVQSGLQESLPAGAVVQRFAARVCGCGSLGRPRFVAVAAWHGGRIVREAKALVPAAWDWAHGNAGTGSRFIDLATQTYRAPDPFLFVRDGFIFRRIAADSRKVELGVAAGAGLKVELLEAMGFDLGAIHAAAVSEVGAIHDDLGKRSVDWLHKAARAADAAVEEDYRRYSNQDTRQGGKQKAPPRGDRSDFDPGNRRDRSRRG